MVEKIVEVVMVRFTPTQQRIMDLLSDGQPHGRTELHGCLRDSLSEVQTIENHISHLRKVLRPRGEDIICVRRIAIENSYQLVRLFHSTHDGKR